MVERPIFAACSGENAGQKVAAAVIPRSQAHATVPASAAAAALPAAIEEEKEEKPREEDRATEDDLREDDRGAAAARRQSSASCWKDVSTYLSRGPGTRRALPMLHEPSCCVPYAHFPAAKPVLHCCKRAMNPGLDAVPTCKTPSGAQQMSNSSPACELGGSDDLKADDEADREDDMGVDSAADDAEATEDAMLLAETAGGREDWAADDDSKDDCASADDEIDDELTVTAAKASHFSWQVF